MMEERPEVKDAVSLARNRRTDAMFVCAYIAVGALIYMVVYETQINDFAQGVITTVLMMFVSELKNMYSYETGTTRASEQKGAAITRIAEQSAPTSAASVAAVVAATAAASGAPAIPVVPPPAGQP